MIYSWFSDTFIVYSKDDTERDFTNVEQVGRLFFQKLILRHIPVRAALTHGELYSQSLQNIFVGPALIDAYNYAESQDWLGFILTPKVFQRLEGTSLALTERLHYRQVKEPGIIRCEVNGPVYAFAFNNGAVNKRCPYLSALGAMQGAAPAIAKGKYERTIAFAEQHCA